jgi:hypothetical protein
MINKIPMDEIEKESKKKRIKNNINISKKN